jgi:SpoVK/Ycf46/Vps4 family AAA+-type ATPase
MDALEQLDHYAEVFLSAGTTTFGGISPRTKVLLLGGTGAGKTSVVRKFAQRSEWRFVSIDSSAWIPEGSAKPGSLSFIRDFVRSLESGEYAVLMLDEVDKLLPAGDAALDTNWSTSVFGEVLAAVDQDERLLGHNWTKADLEQFRSSVFLVAAGAFEFYLRKVKQKARGSHLGFGNDNSKSLTFSEFLDQSQAIPSEISSRFAPPIFIQSPTASDFKRVITKIHEDLGFPASKPVEELAIEATSTVGGLRWAENYVTQLLFEHPKTLPPTPPAPSPAKKREADEHGTDVFGKIISTAKFDFFSPDTTHHVRILNDDVFALQRVLTRIVCAIAIADSEGRLPKSSGDPLYQYLSSPEPIQAQVERALSGCEITAEISSEFTGNLRIINLALRLWEGIRGVSPGLQKCGLLDLWQEAFDLCGRVNQRRHNLSQAAANGRYKT